jgi:ABC-type spermidine/putrescine transport system permease subunit II
VVTTRTAALAVRLARAVLVVVAAGPFLILPIRAVADVWRAPALLPQDWGLRGVRAVLDDPLLATAARNSLVIALAATALGLLVAWPAARSLAAWPTRSWAVLVLGAPLLVPPLAVGQGLSTWFLRIHLDGRPGVVLAHLVYVVPYQVLALLPAFTSEQRGRDEAASSLGAGPLRRLLTVTLADVRRSLALAVALGFTVSWSQYGATLGVGGGIVTLPVVLVPFVRTDPQIAAVLDLLLLAVPLALIAGAAAVDDHARRRDEPIGS